jgi:hypothetical protein
MTATGSRRLIYPAQRAVEHAATAPGVRPLRLFALLWPLRQIETTADIYDEQPYELIERFVVLTILDGGLTQASHLARFLGIPESLVHRCLNLLSVIGHVELDGDSVQLTELGTYSARAQIRYVAKESRQDLLIEAFTTSPLPRRYYEKAVRVVPSATGDDKRLAASFTPLFAGVPFRPEVVEQLAGRPDRADYNLPEQLRQLRIVRTWDAFLPVYLIETAGDDLLAYSAAGTPRDTFIEDIYRQVPQIREMINNESCGNPQDIWTHWLANSRYGAGLLQRLPNGLWRVTFRADAFGPDASLRLTQVGSFRFQSKHFVQLWCDDERIRRAALLDRSLRMLQLPGVVTHADLLDQTAPLSTLLELPAPTLTELRQYAEREGAREWLARLDALA